MKTTLTRHRRVFTSLALMAGLALTGAGTASASGSAVGHDARAALDAQGKSSKRVCVIITDKHGKKTEAKGVKGKYYAGGKPASASDLRFRCPPPYSPGKPGHGKDICVIIHKGHKTVVSADVAVGAASAAQTGNRKPPKEHKCPPPYSPGKPGKGHGKHACVIVRKDSKGNQVTTEIRDGKVYVNGKLVTKGKLPKCPPPPGLPGELGQSGSTAGK